MEYLSQLGRWIYKLTETSYDPDFIVNCEDFTLMHTRQEDRMDCGPACIRMVHKWATGGYDSCRTDLCAGRNEPWWSIDLLVVLREMDVCEAQLFTTCIGVDVHHRALDWYSKEPSVGDRNCADAPDISIESDFRRVQDLFAHGLRNQWSITNKRLDNYDLILALSLRQAVAVVLIHNPVLGANISEGRGLLSSLGGGPEVVDPFYGHYVVLIGEYLVLNPSSADPAVERITTRMMNAARRHVGTDNDVILCFPKKELAHPEG